MGLLALASPLCTRRIIGGLPGRARPLDLRLQHLDHFVNRRRAPVRPDIAPLPVEVLGARLFAGVIDLVLARLMPELPCDALGRNVAVHIAWHVELLVRQPRALDEVPELLVVL